MSLADLEIQRYYQSESKFKGYSHNNLPKTIMDGI